MMELYSFTGSGPVLGPSIAILQLRESGRLRKCDATSNR